MDQAERFRSTSLALALSVWIAASSLATASAFALEDSIPPGWVAFDMPWDDATGGSADVSSLLDRPAGAKGFVEARDGHFFVGKERIRFWGVNLCFAACFPPPETADRVAARLAKFGINCVRFHHMDMYPYPSGIFRGRDLEELSNEALERLDHFIAALKARGIYSNLNLHVSRWWSRADGWPQADRLESFDKMLDLVHPELIGAQRRYARDLLLHRNSVTGNRYVDEPALAMVEITNEDSLFMWGTPGAIERLPEPYAGVFRGLWTKWLAARHGTEEVLRREWQRGAVPLGENRMRDVGFQSLAGLGSAEWGLEQHSGARASARALPGKADPAKANEPAALRVEIAESTQVSWHVQWKQGGHAVERGAFYTVRFRARADREKTISVSVGQDHEPWGGLGLASAVTLGKEWKAFRLGFAASASDANARVVFQLGGDTTAVEIAEPGFHLGGQEGLRTGESLAEGTVALFPEGASTDARTEDRLRFLGDTERSYFTGMRGFLRETLRVRVPITGTIAFGALGTRVQAEMDFVDQHSYWQHPNFPRKPWDSRDWTVENHAMSASASGGTFPGLAVTRVAGKPYTVTEYNHPAPMDSQAETIPMISAFGALQDWDGIFLFAYNHANRFDRNAIDGFFDIDSNPAKMLFCGAGALIFAGGAVPPAEASWTFPMSEEDAVRSSLRQPTHLDIDLRDRGFKIERLLESRWAVEFIEGQKASEPPAPGPSPAAWTWNPGASFMVGGSVGFVVDAPRLKIVCGNGRYLRLDGVTLQVGSPERWTLVLVSQDGRPLDVSSRMLLVACGRVENTGMGWNAERNSVGDRWGGSPVLVEVLEAWIELGGAPARIHPLDGRGQRTVGLAGEAVEGGTRFRLGGVSASPWYEISR